MKQVYKTALYLIWALALCVGWAVPVRAMSSYTYNFGGGSFIYPSPALPPYRHSRSLIAADLGVEDLSKLAGLAVGDDKLYITNGGQVIVTDHDFNPITTVAAVTEDGAVQGLTDLAGICAAANGRVYVCEPRMGRVLMFDAEMNFLRAYYKPEGMILPASVSYTPTRVAVDHFGRMYVVAANVYEGIVEIDSDGSFSRYFGQVKVTYTVMDLFWRSIQTAAQRATAQTWLPVNFSNLAVDEDGFVLATVAGENEEEPVRKLNSKGVNILRFPKDPDFPPMGDMWINDFAATVPAGPSNLTVIEALGYGVYFVYDAKRAHTFAYDDDGYMLFAFGGSGYGKGLFLNVSDMRAVGDRLVYLDAGALSVEVFELTEYGRAILSASRLQYESDYPAAAEAWQRAIDLNPFFQYGYVGVGKALYYAGETEQAAEYFLMGRNEDYYSMAFQKNRQNAVTENFTWVFAGILILAAAAAALRVVRRWKRRGQAE